MRLARFNTKRKWSTRTTRVNLLKHGQAQGHDRDYKRHNHYVKIKQLIRIKLNSGLYYRQH